MDDPGGAVWYGARRIFAFALMIREGIPADEAEPYLRQRAWLADAARLLDRTPEALATELVPTMLRSGAVVLRDGRLHAAADHAPVAAESLRVPFPRVAGPGASLTEDRTAAGHLVRPRTKYAISPGRGTAPRGARLPDEDGLARPQGLAGQAGVAW